MTTAALDVSNPNSASTYGSDLETALVPLVQRGPLVITDQATAQLAVDYRQDLGEAIKRVKALLGQPKAMAYQLWKTLCSREAALLQPLEAADRATAAAISAYKTEQDRIRVEAERAEADRRKAEDDQRAITEAAHLEAQGEHALAAAVLEDAAAAPAQPVALPDVTKQVAGLKFRRVWKWHYTGGPLDPKQTPPAVRERAMQLVPREFLTVDETKIGAYARSMKSSGSIPGIEIFFSDEPVR